MYKYSNFQVITLTLAGNFPFYRVKFNQINLKFFRHFVYI